MTKTEMTTLLRSVGVNENTITAMENAYEMGVEFERKACALMVEREWSTNQEKELCDELAAYIRIRGEEQEGLWLGKEAEARAWKGDQA